MKIQKKIAAVLLAVLMLVSVFTGCSAKPETAYTSEDQDLAIGVYIYSLYVAYNQAQSLASTVEGYDKEKSFLTLEIQGEDDDEAMPANDWILKEAEKLCLTMLAVQKECAAKGAFASDEDLAAAKAQATSDWQFGPYYQYYASMGYSSTPYQTVLEPHGVSYESFELASYVINVNQVALFEKIYGEGGEKEVPVDELKAFFTENYTDYDYFPVALTNSVTGEDGNATTEAMSEDEVEAVRVQLQAYVDSINDGTKTYSEVTDTYTAAAELESNPSVTKTEQLSESTVNADVVAAVGELADGKATLVKSGTDTSAAYYVVFKSAIADAVEANFDTDDEVYNYLVAYKSEEFNDYINTVVDQMTADGAYTKNSSVINKYKPKMFETK